MSNDDILCVIPARGGSKGLARKNVLPLAGKPLIAYPIEAALKSGVVGHVVVTTDDEEIGAVARAAGAEVPFMRPAEISGDLATTEDTLRHALLAYEELTGKRFELCVFLTCTDIFRDPEWLKEAVRLMRERPELESVFSGHKTHKNFWVRNDDGSWERMAPWMAVYSSRQVRRFVVREDTGLTCVSRAHLWRAGRRIGDTVEILVNGDAATGLDIHDEFDFFIAEQAMLYRTGRHKE